MNAGSELFERCDADAVGILGLAVDLQLQFRSCVARHRRARLMNVVRRGLGCVNQITQFRGLDIEPLGLDDPGTPIDAWGEALHEFEQAIACAVLIGTGVALAPVGSWDSWFNDVLGEIGYTALPGGRSSIAAPWNRSIPGLVARFFVPNKYTDPVLDSPATAGMLSAALILVLLAVSAWVLCRSMRNADRGPKDRDLELSLISVFVFLASPASWTHHLVILLPAALVMLRDGVLDRNASVSSRFSAGLTLAVIAITFDDLIPREVRISSPAIMSLMTVAVLALWLLIAERLLRRSAPRRDLPDQAPQPL